MMVGFDSHEKDLTEFFSPGRECARGGETRV